MGEKRIAEGGGGRRAGTSSALNSDSKRRGEQKHHQQQSKAQPRVVQEKKRATEPEAPPSGPQTTMMLRNIPNRYTQAMLLEELKGRGYQGTFDFFYLPIDFRNRCNVGYAFINFSTQ